MTEGRTPTPEDLQPGYAAAGRAGPTAPPPIAAAAVAATLVPPGTMLPPAMRPPSYSVRQKTLAAQEHHHDGDRPGKPLFLLVIAGLLALCALGGMIYVAYQTFHEHLMTVSAGWGYLIPLGILYLLFVFLFSYGYELYDMKKAIKTTFIIGILGLVAVVVCGVVFALLAKSGGSISGGKSSGSSKSSGKSSGGSKASSSSSSSGSSSGGGGYFYYGHRPFWNGWGGGGRRDLPSDEAAASMSVTCSGCGRTFPLLAMQERRCPYCAAPV